MTLEFHRRIPFGHAFVTTQSLYEKLTEKHFLNGRDGLAMHRSGQGLFLPRAKF